jgi:UDP-galactopyranose mutase
MLGPVVKINPASLPRAANVHYLGPKAYAELPGYLGGWDVGIMPFAHNEATRYISPTKTPEYLAAGLPVISTPIRDVVRPYGDAGFVYIANSPQEWSEAIFEALHESKDSISRSNMLRRIDDFLKGSSWDRTWTEMMSLIDVAIAKRDATRPMRARAQ